MGLTICYIIEAMKNKKEETPNKASATYRYVALIEVLASRPVITPMHVRHLMSLEQEILEENPDTRRDYKDRISQTLTHWNDELYYLAYQQTMIHAIEARTLLKNIELTKFWLRCSDAVLDKPLFPGHPEHFETMYQMIGALRHFQPELCDVTSTALDYNQELSSPHPNETQVQSLHQTYHTMRDAFLRLPEES